MKYYLSLFTGISLLLLTASGCGSTGQPVENSGKTISTTGIVSAALSQAEHSSATLSAEVTGMITKPVSDNPYFNFKGTDPYGNRSISVFGDSITHGANSIDIPENSYIGLLKKAITRETGSTNYGFTSIEGTMWNSAGVHQEMHQVTFDTTVWKERRSGGNVGTFTLYTKVPGAALDIAVRKSFHKFCIYYAVGMTSGEFEIVSGGKVLAKIDGYAEKPGFSRSDYIDYSGVVNNQFSIRNGTEGKLVSINGVGYYDDINDIVVNNYSNNGLMLQTMNESVIAFMCKADTVIFALGYNDSHFTGSPEKFTEKINLVIKNIQLNHAKLIVNDLCWNLDSSDYYRKELKRLATECNGIYIDYQAVYGEKILVEIKDTAHPTILGHKMIADELLRILQGGS